jgi:Cysteine-rich CWC
MSDKTCPFCKNHNECMAHKKELCWCNELKIPSELIELVPDELKRKACICKSCINLFIKDPKGFKEQFVNGTS